MHLAHLCSSLFIPSKQKASPSPQVLVYCLYGAFITSLLFNTTMGFQF